MNGWHILAIVLFALFLISKIRLGVSARYGGEGFRLRAKVGLLRATLYPIKPKKTPKKEKKERKKTKKERETMGKNGGNFAIFKEFLPVITDAAGQFKRKLRIDDLELHLTWASPDPAATAMGYGGANAALGMLWPLLAHNFTIRNHHIEITADFEKKSPVIYAYAALTLTVGQILLLGLRIAIKGFAAYRRYKKEGETDNE